MYECISKQLNQKRSVGLAQVVNCLCTIQMAATVLQSLNTEDLLSRLKLKKPTALATKHIWNIYNCEEAFLVQSPWLTIPYSVIFNDDFSHFQFDCCNEDFVNTVGNLQDHIVTRIRRSGVDLGDRHFVNHVKPRLVSKVLRVRGLAADVQFYDQSGRKLEEGAKCLSRHKRTRIIFWLRWFWCSDKYYGIEFQPLQIKVEQPPAEPLFQEEPDFGVYHRMLKVKVPMAAVLNKMRLDGCSEAEIKAFLGGATSEAPSPVPVCPPAAPLAPRPPPPPPPPRGGLPPPAPPPPRAPAPSSLAFLKQIKNGEFKLKPKGQHPPAAALKSVDTSHKVPSLQDILAAKSRLKSRNNLSA
jgi:hypothetical protein